MERKAAMRSLLEDCEHSSAEKQISARRRERDARTREKGKTYNKTLAKAVPMCYNETTIKRRSAKRRVK